MPSRLNLGAGITEPFCSYAYMLQKCLQLAAWLCGDWFVPVKLKLYFLLCPPKMSFHCCFSDQVAQDKRFVKQYIS